jgi:hypothetical protein
LTARLRPSRRVLGAGVLLVAVEDDGQAVSVWHAELGDVRAGRATLAEDGWVALEAARRAVAARPSLHPERLAPAAVRLSFVGRSGSGSISPALVGGSFGLALALAWAGRAMAWTPPVDAVAIARIDARGAVADVDPEGLRIKLAGLRVAAPDVRRVLVSPVDAARIEAPAGLVLVPVSTLQEALAALHAPEPFEALSSADAEAAAVALYRAVRQGGALPVPWTAVVETARRLTRTVVTPRGRWSVDVAARMASRHLGAVAEAAIPWPDNAWLAALEPRLPGRLQLIAQVVQSAADVDDAAALEAVARARGMWARPSLRTEHHARLMGACARALAAAGDRPAALKLARQAWREWSLLEDVGSASFILVEGLRLADGLGARVQGQEAASLARSAWAVAPEGSIGRAYLAHALARHAVCNGDRAEGAAWLARVEVTGGWMPDDLSVGRARLRIRLGVAGETLGGVLGQRVWALCAVDAFLGGAPGASSEAAWEALGAESHLSAWRDRIGARVDADVDARVTAFGLGYPYS